MEHVTEWDEVEDLHAAEVKAMRRLREASGRVFNAQTAMAGEAARKAEQKADRELFEIRQAMKRREAKGKE